MLPTGNQLGKRDARSVRNACGRLTLLSMDYSDALQGVITRIVKVDVEDTS